jgi:hypothetical protein
MIAGIGSGVFASYVWPRITIPFEVKEPIEILNYTSELSFFPGETKYLNVTVQNHASLSYNVTLDFQLNDSVYQAAYVTFSDEIYTVEPGQQDLVVWIMVDAAAPPITCSLTVKLKRGHLTYSYKLFPSDDSRVKRQSFDYGVWTNTSDFNYGNSTWLVLHTTTTDDREGRVFLKFSLTSISYPEEITSVKLFLFKTPSYPPGWGGVGNVEARAVSDDSWIEGNITWNNQPAYGNLLDTVHVIFGSSQWYSWDVTSFILNELAGDGDASICLKAENEDQGNTYRCARFRSKEYDCLDPYLLVEYK